MTYFKRHLIAFEEPHDTRKRYINVSIENDSVGSVNSHKTVVFRLSDDEDLFFLYSTLITHEDFNNLKSQQGLLVDFSGFGQKVIDLLQLCSLEELNCAPKYCLKFSRNSADDPSIGILQIIEATNFKYLVHLSLNLNAGNDYTVKNHLVALIKSLRVESDSAIKKLESVNQQLVTSLDLCKNELETLHAEYDHFKVATLEKEAGYKERYKTECASLEKELITAKDSYDELLEEQKRRAEERVDSIRVDFEAKMKTLQWENHQLSDEKKQLEGKVNILLEQSNNLSNQNTSMKEDIIGLRSQLTSLDNINQTNRAAITRLEARIATLEDEVTAKEQTITKNQELLNAEREQRVRCQEELQNKSQQLEKTEKSLRNESEENTKANEIITRLQNEVRSYHTKAKLRGQVATEQERLLSSKESELREVRSEADRLASEARESKDKIASLTTEYKQVSADLDEAKKTIRTNENIIAWLNRQISEAQLGHLTQRLKSTTPTPGMALASTTTLGLSSADTGNPETLLVTGKRSTPPASSRYQATPSNPNCPPWQLLGGNNPPQPTSTPTTTISLPLRPLATLNREPPGSGMSKYSGYLPSMQKTYGEKRLSTLPAPVTKSTPLHQDNLTLSRDASHKYSATASVTSGTAEIHGRLPSYIPSTLIARLGGDLGSAITDANPLLAVQSAAARRPIGAERMLQQQSLTSAYFPKSVGADVRQ